MRGLDVKGVIAQVQVARALGRAASPSGLGAVRWRACSLVESYLGGPIIGLGYRGADRVMRQAPHLLNNFPVVVMIERKLGNTLVNHLVLGRRQVLVGLPPPPGGLVHAGGKDVNALLGRGYLLIDQHVQLLFIVGLALGLGDRHALADAVTRQLLILPSRRDHPRGVHASSPEVAAVLLQLLHF